MRIGHAFGGADRIALDQAIDDLGSAGERSSVHGTYPLTFTVYNYIYMQPLVNRLIYMNFREAVDALCMPIDHKDVAEALGVSVQTVRQARMKDDSSAFRAPPKDWKSAIIRLAEKRVWHYRQLIDKVREKE